MRDKRRLNTNRLGSVLLFFCITFFLTFYSAVMSEYSFNQWIDRGFISSHAVFFRMELNDSNSAISSDLAEDNGTSHAAGSEPDSIRSSSIFSTLLHTTPKRDYVFAYQEGVVRAIFYQGNNNIPPLLSGDFFSETDCLATEPKAVIGRNHLEETTTHPGDSRQFIEIEGVEYVVIGVMAMDAVTTIDDLIYVNIGSIPSDKTLSGRFYLDSQTQDAHVYYEEFLCNAKTYGITEVQEILLPETPTDIVAGGLFLSDLLQGVIAIFLIGAYLSVFVFFLLSRRKFIAVSLLGGEGYWTTSLRVFLQCAPSGIVGIVSAWFIFLFIDSLHIFALPSLYLVREASLYSAVALTALCLWLAPILLYMTKIEVSQSLRE